MWRRISSVRPRPTALVLLAALLSPAATPVLGQEPVGLSVSQAVGPALAATLEEDPWQPATDLANAIRARVARRWGLSPDSVQIEWSRPTGSLDGIDDVTRLLGPGRAGSWIAVLASERRASLRFRAGVRVWTPVARTDLPRGRALTADDIEWAHAVAWGPPIDLAYRTRPGWITRRPIDMGEPLVAPAVTAPPAVQSGETVTVRLTAGRVTIELPGRALGEAAHGESVLVRLNTGTRIRGVASDSNTVVLSQPAYGTTTGLAARRRPVRQN